MANLTLDQIMFDTSEPERSKLLNTFVANEPEVHIKALPKQTYKVGLEVNGEWQTITIPPRGKICGARTAIELLYRYGRGGVYQGKDMATGHTQATLSTIPFEERKELEARPDFKIITFHLYDATYEGDEDEAAEEAKAAD